MTKVAHTPGPWTTGRSELEVVDPKGRMIAALGAEAGANQKEEEQLSNARLIAAAPELLEALEFFFNIMHDYESSLRKGYVKLALDQARAALARAKGGAV